MGINLLDENLFPTKKHAIWHKYKKIKKGGCLLQH